MNNQSNLMNYFLFKKEHNKQIKCTQKLSWLSFLRIMSHFKGFWLFNNFGSSLLIFGFVLWQTFTVGEQSGLQTGPFRNLDTFTSKPCCCNRCCMWFRIVFVENFQFFLKTRWEHVALKPNQCTLFCIFQMYELPMP